MGVPAPGVPAPAFPAPGVSRAGVPAPGFPRLFTFAPTALPPMLLLYHFHDLTVPSGLHPAFTRVTEALRKGDFRAADVKKLVGTTYYRARLNDTDRLLFRFADFDGQRGLLLLELILNHAYDRSAFLRGTAAAPTTAPVALAASDQVPTADVLTLPQAAPTATTRFHYLDRPLFFDPDQAAVFALPTPLIIIGSAGSGKTALTLEKLKTLTGTAKAPARVLYVTLSAYLAENAARLYHAHAPAEAQQTQEIDFLSLRELLESIRVPAGREVTFRDFSRWFGQHRPYARVKDGDRLFEEFHGVLTGADPTQPFLALPDYEALGVRQSAFGADERADVYALFTKYLAFLADNTLYNPHIAAFGCLALAEAQYDFVVVDEVQDLTNTQLRLILNTLRKKGGASGNFVLCGDSHQVVHPNYFSWANIKSMFYRQEKDAAQTLHLLRTNYRNSPPVTALANRLLRIKNLRFGSIDRESTFLVESAAPRAGEVGFVKDSDAARRQLNSRIRRSARFAVVVLREEDKAEVRRQFDSPLIFSVQEAKGLEYDNIVLVGFVSQQEKLFREIADGIDPADLEGELRYARADRADKQLETYKFFVNALYVALTRAVHNLYIVEARDQHPLLALLGLTNARAQAEVKTQESTADEWRHEARKLELQGKTEQAASIRQQILGQQAPTWPVLTFSELTALRTDAFDPARYNKKAKDRLFEYAIVYYDIATLDGLARLTGPQKYNPARPDNLAAEMRTLLRKRYGSYHLDRPQEVAARVARYGPDVRDELGLTPLLAAVHVPALKTIAWLRAQDADPARPDLFGRTPWQHILQHFAHEPATIQPHLAALYAQLALPALHLRLDGQALKFRADQPEYFVLNYLLLNQLILLRRKSRTDRRYQWRPGFVEAADVQELMEAFPDSLVPPHRKARLYLNALLARHEMRGRSEYGRRLWFRVKNGHYLLNPALETEGADGEWRPLRALLPALLLTDAESRVDTAVALHYQRLPEYLGGAPVLNPGAADDEEEEQLPSA